MNGRRYFAMEVGEKGVSLKTFKKVLDSNSAKFDEALKNMEQRKATPLQQDFGLAWIYWTNNLDHGNGTENDAIMYSKHDLVLMQRLDLNSLASSKPTFAGNSEAILKRAKELNPKLRYFEYIQSESGRTDFTYNGDHAHLNPDGTWEDSTAALSGCTRIYTYDQICDWLDYFKETGADGVFWDDWGYDFAKEDICYQMGLSVDDYEDKNAALNEKWKMLISACHERGLALVTNGGRPFSVGDWYTYLNEQDIIAMESCMISSNDNTWRNGQTSLYDYYINWYSNGKCKAKIWSLDYAPKSSGDYRNQLITYLCAMGLACGAHYVSMGVNAFMEKPFFIESLTEGTQKSVTKMDDNTYHLKVGDHELEVHRWKGANGSVSESSISKCYYLYDSTPFNNAFLTASGVGYQFSGRLSTVESLIDGMTEDNRKNSSSFWRIAIDDWQPNLSYLDYKNLMILDAPKFTYSYPGKAEASLIKNDDGTVDLEITYTDCEQNNVSFDIITQSNYESLKLTGQSLEFGFSDVIFNMSDGSWTLPNGTPYYGSSDWAIPSFRPYFTCVVDGNTESIDYIKGVGSEIGESTGHYERTKSGEITSVRMYVWIRTTGTSQLLNGTITIKNLYLVDTGEHADEISKKWYTNIFPSGFNNTSALTVSKTASTKQTRPVYDMTVTIDNPWGWSMYSFSSDEVIALRGHTLELGCSSMTFSNGETGRPRADWSSFAFGISTSTTDPTEVRLYSDISEESAVWNEKLTCCTFTVPENATALIIGFKSYGFPTGTVLTIKDAYLYDLEEEVSVRGKATTNASLRICRVNEEQEAETPSNFRNALYITEKGRMYCYDLKGTKVDIAGSMYAGAVEAGYTGSPTQFGIDLYKLTNTNIGGIADSSRLLPIPTSDDEGKILKVVDGKWVANDDEPSIVNQIPENIVLYEETDDEDSPIEIEGLIKEHLTLDADGEYLYLLYDSKQLSKVPMGGGSGTIYCSGIKIKESDMTLSINSENAYALSVVIEPSDCTQTVKWSSSDTSVISISSKGELSIVGEGSAIITVKCGNYSDTITITVVDPVVKVNVEKGSSWFTSNGIPGFGGNDARAFAYIGSTPPLVAVDSSYTYGVPLKKGVKYNAELNAASGCYYGLQIYSSVSKTRVVDSGWQNPGTKYVYTPTEDGLYLYVNFKYGAAGSATITDEILANIKAGFTIMIGDS